MIAGESEPRPLIIIASHIEYMRRSNLFADSAWREAASGLPGQARQ
jgi:hypothetical protein